MNPESHTELSELSDEALVSMRETEPRIFLVLLRRYGWLAANFAAKAAENPADVDDLTQEGLLALCAAAESFSVEYGASFRTFAAVCMRRRILTASRAVSSALQSVSSSLDDPEVPSDLLLADESASPELLLLAKERVDELYHLLTDVLSKHEREIFCLQVSGFSYAEIAHRLVISKKSVENAIQRARRKLRAVRSGENLE